MIARLIAVFLLGAAAAAVPMFMTGGLQSLALGLIVGAAFNLGATK
jgi:hypothetical protein